MAVLALVAFGPVIPEDATDDVDAGRELCVLMQGTDFAATRGDGAIGTTGTQV
ncbi:hypothetical protein [Dactylosporangium sp. NPDC000521]|uniref:hypothetical protein n=1 Tax=Dactylosporangium sp. NPDC000521 TaxID=3363975 RepID=UPI00367C2056